MRWSSRAGWGLVPLLLTGGCGLFGSANHDKAIDAIRAVANAQVKAYADRSPREFLATFADDARFMYANQRHFSGKAEAGRMFEAGLKDPTLETGETIQTVAVADSNDLGYVRGNYTLGFTNPSTRTATTETGSFLMVVRKQPDGGWKVVEDMTTPGVQP